VFTQSGTADYRLRVSLLSIPVGEAHLTVRNGPADEARFSGHILSRVACVSRTR